MTQTTFSKKKILHVYQVDVFLGPFLDVVRSEVVGPITGVALSSINKFLAYGLIDLTSPHAAAGIESIADAVTHTKFMGTDLASDEVVLMKILQVLRTILLTPVGACMSNEAVCELMQTCFKICFEMRLSELLRRCAEQTLTDMIHLLFSRLAVLAVPDKNDVANNSPVKNSLSRTSDVPRSPSVSAETSVEEDARADAADAGGDEDARAAATPVIADTHRDGATPTPIVATDSSESGPAAEERTNKFGVRFTSQERGGVARPDGDGSSEQVSYGIPCIRELFRFITSLINPRDRHNNETMIGMGLSLLTVAMETGGAHMSRFVTLKEYLEDDMCHNLFELLRTENLTLYAATLRVIFLTFEAMRDPLKFQLERFVTIVCEMDYDQHSVEHKEGAMDTLLQLCRVPSFLIELYLNFDCNLHCSNLFEKVVTFLSQNALPEDRVLATHLNALDSLLSVVQEISNRDSAESGDAALPEESSSRSNSSDGMPEAAVSGNSSGGPALPSPSIEELRKVKQQKALLATAIETFNTDSSSKALKFMSEHGFMSSPTPEWTEVAAFLRETPGLSKAEIGEFIGKRKNKPVLAPYVQLFDVTNQPIDHALRQFLEAFRLPGEAPVISNILEDFANSWFDSYTGVKVPKDPDAAFILCYAIMQLNTDQHNPQVKDRMTFKDFVKNQRNLNANEDYPKEFLLDIFNSIRDTEIVLPSERKGALKEEYEWKLVLARVRDPKRNAGMIKCNGSSDYDKEMFSLIWKPTITALYQVLDTAADDVIVDSILDSLGKCAAICARFELCEVFDSLIIALCKRTLLTTQPPSETEPENEASQAATVPFTLNPKAHQVAKLTFKLCREHGSIMRHGWANIMDVILNLFHARLLPDTMTTVAGYLQDEWSLLPDEKQEQTRANDSWFPFWGATVSESSGDSETEQSKATSEARLVVEACSIQAMFAESAFLQEASLKELFKSLMHLSRSPVSHVAMGLDMACYDEMVSIFFLEQVYEVAKANKDRIDALWETLHGHLHALAVGAEDMSRLSSRALVCLIKLGERLYKTDQLDQRVLDSFAVFEQLPAPLKADTIVRAQIVAGLSSFVKTNASFLSRRGWEVFMSTLRGATNDQLANECAVDALQFVTESALTPDNVGLCQVTAVGYVDLAIESTLAAVQTGGALDDSAAPPEPLAAKVLNVLHGLHVAIPKVYEGKRAGVTLGSLWALHWESILQAMSRFCTVAHRPVRQQALTLLQSSLMLPDLDQMSAAEWKMCLEKVLFPLLSALLVPPAKSASVAALEEIRVRANTLLSKVFLQRLSVLVTLEDFVDVWLTMLGYLERYMNAGTELAEAVPESLKNMLLVMSTTGILHPSGQADSASASAKEQQRTYVNGLWSLTYTRLEEFLPGLFHEVLPGHSASSNAVTMGPPPAVAVAMTPAAGMARPPLATMVSPPPAMAVPGPTIVVSPGAAVAPAFNVASPAMEKPTVVAGSAEALQLPQDTVLSPIVLGNIPSFSPAGLTPNIGTMFSSSQPFQMASPAAGTPIRLTEAYPEMFSTPGTIPSPAFTPQQPPLVPSTPTMNAPIQLHSTPQLSNISSPP